MSSPRYTSVVQSLPDEIPFVGPEAQERQTGVSFKARIGANENVFGCSPNAISAMQSAAKDVWMYGDPENHDLRIALADHLDVEAANIVVAEGVDALLGYTARLLVEPGDTVVTSAGAYPNFNHVIRGFGGDLRTVPFKGHHEDLGALIDCARETQAKLIYFANPDNPLGSHSAGALIAEQLDRIPDGCLLLMDEAYIEMAPDGTAPIYPVEHPKIIRMRTFSKAYGMAGARVGYAVGAKHLIGQFEKIRNQFGVSRISQAGALAALRDQSWLDETKIKIAASRERIAQIAEKNGMVALPSATNFVAVDTKRDAAFVSELMEVLASRGVFVRRPFVEDQQHFLRVSCGTPADLDLLERVLPTAIEEVSS